MLKKALALCSSCERGDDPQMEFDAVVAKGLPAVNKSHSHKKLELMLPIDRKAWDAADSDSGTGAIGAVGLIRKRDDGVLLPFQSAFGDGIAHGVDRS